MYQKGINRELAHVEFRDSEQIQGFWIRLNKTAVTVGDYDCAGRVHQQVPQLILLCPTCLS